MSALDQLVNDFKQAKADEQCAINARRAIEEQILALLPSKDEGSVTKKTESGTTVTATYKVTRKVDSELLQDCWNDLSENAQKCFKWSADVSISAMRSLQGFDEDSYKLAAHFITATPAKPSLSVKS